MTQPVRTTPRPGRTLSGYPSRTVASTTGAGFTNFPTASTSRNNAGKALMIRPARSLFFETGAAWVLDCMYSSPRESSERKSTGARNRSLFCPPPEPVLLRGEVRPPDHEQLERRPHEQVSRAGAVPPEVNPVDGRVDVGG